MTTPTLHKNLTELAPGDVIVDFQGSRYIVTTPVIPYHSDADEFEPAYDGWQFDVTYPSTVSDEWFTRHETVIPVRGPESIIYRIEAE